MTKVVEIEDRVAEAWRLHGIAGGLASMSEDHDQADLLGARTVVAKRYPGCTRAILNPDPAMNWDRGGIIQGEVARIKAERGGG